MQLSSTLTHILLQSLLVLALVSVMLGAVIVSLRRRYRRLLRVYEKLRASRRSNGSATAMPGATGPNKTSQNQTRPDNTERLRERVRSLRAMETDNAALKVQNQQAARQIHQLKGYYKKYRALTAHLASQREAEASVNNLTATSKRQQTLLQTMQTHTREPPHEDFYRDKKPLLERLQALTEDAEGYLNGVHALQQRKEQPDMRVLQRLSEQNRQQQVTIAELTRELKCLRRAMDDQDMADKGELHKLERLVKECETCIHTLEEEVEFLQRKLQAAEQDDEDPLTDAMPGFAMAIVSKHQPEDMLALVGATLTQCNLPFALRYSYGGARFYRCSAELDSALMTEKLDRIAEAGSGTDAEGNLCLDGEILQCIIPGEGVARYSAESVQRLLIFMQELVQLQAGHMGVVSGIETQHRQLIALGEAVHKGLTTIDIQYAYQTEETKRLIDVLVAELQQLATVAEMDQEMRDLFDSTISEAKSRIQTLYTTGSSVDKELAALEQLVDEIK